MIMSRAPVSVCLSLAAMLCLVGCGGGNNNFKKTYPVKGRIQVDGKSPESQIAISCVNLAGYDPQNPTESQCFSNPDGTFEISTYNTGDGVPEGEYALTFLWGQLNVFSMSYGGPDKLGGQYRDPATSPVKFKVVAGKPVDLGTIELKSGTPVEVPETAPAFSEASVKTE
jgi:hypothetical protein